MDSTLLQQADWCEGYGSSSQLKIYRGDEKARCEISHQSLTHYALIIYCTCHDRPPQQHFSSELRYFLMKGDELCIARAVVNHYHYYGLSNYCSVIAVQRAPTVA